MRHNQNHKESKGGECEACKAERFFDKATKIMRTQKLLSAFNLGR